MDRVGAIVGNSLDGIAQDTSRAVPQKQAAMSRQDTGGSELPAAGIVSLKLSADGYLQEEDTEKKIKVLLCTSHFTETSAQQAAALWLLAVCRHVQTCGKLLVQKLAIW